MKRSSELLLQFVAALREEGADLPETDHNVVSALSDALDAWTSDGNEPEWDRVIHTLWIAANVTFDPNWGEEP